MGSMATCACGWTIISPVGADDVRKHLQIHLREIVSMRPAVSKTALKASRPS